MQEIILEAADAHCMKSITAIISSQSRGENYRRLDVCFDIVIVHFACNLKRLHHSSVLFIHFVINRKGS